MSKKKKNTYKKRRYLHKTAKRTQGGGTKLPFDASKIHPAALILDKKFSIKKSSVHGVGAFAAKPIAVNEVIHCAIHTLSQPNKEGYLFNITDDFGRYINHSSAKPNAELIKLHDGNYYVMATNYIPKDAEILVNYDDKKLPSFIKGSMPHYKPG